MTSTKLRLESNRPVHSPRRSFLYVPGDAKRKIEKAATWQVDAVILDLEDGVAINQKFAARQGVVEALSTLDFGSRERFVRLNALSTGLLEDDLTSTIGTHPNGFVVSKVESPEDLVELTYWLDEAEQLSHWPKDSLRLFAMIESALGIMNLREICTSTTRLDGLIFGAEDYAASVGAIRSREGSEVFFARSAVVAAAAAYGLQAIDQVCVELQDNEQLIAECKSGRQLGFWGKTAIHPNQTAVINQFFSPSESEIEQAQQLIAAFDEHQKSGKGAFAFNNKMVDMPVIRAARRVLERVASGN